MNGKLRTARLICVILIFLALITALFFAFRARNAAVDLKNGALVRVEKLENGILTVIAADAGGRSLRTRLPVSADIPVADANGQQIPLEEIRNNDLLSLSMDENGNLRAVCLDFQ